MFESLDKMIKIENNELFTLNPFAYTKCLQDIDYNENYEKKSVALPVCIEIVCPFYSKYTLCCIIFSFTCKSSDHFDVLLKIKI